MRIKQDTVMLMETNERRPDGITPAGWTLEISSLGIPPGAPWPVLLTIEFLGGSEKTFRWRETQRDDEGGISLMRLEAPDGTYVLIFND